MGAGGGRVGVEEKGFIIILGVSGSHRSGRPFQRTHLKVDRGSQYDAGLPRSLSEKI